MFTTWLTAAVLLPVSLALPAKGAKPKPPAASQAQSQLKKVTQERDELKDRLAATESLQEDLAAAQKSRDMARQETERSRKELEQMKSALAENQGSADTILNELQKAKADLATAKDALAALKGEAEGRKEQLAAPAAEGALVPFSPELTPARPINLARITPQAKKVTGVVVVNVLVSETGEVLDTRLLQGLPGDSEWVAKGNAACVEAAKRIVFDPARAADGRTKVRVWQGVGFMLD
jgi:seryl-tRNA synthetase